VKRLPLTCYRYGPRYFHYRINKDRTNFESEFPSGHSSAGIMRFKFVRFIINPGFIIAVPDQGRYPLLFLLGRSGNWRPDFGEGDNRCEDPQLTAHQRDILSGFINTDQDKPKDLIGKLALIFILMAVNRIDFGEDLPFLKSIHHVDFISIWNNSVGNRLFELFGYVMLRIS